MINYGTTVENDGQLFLGNSPPPTRENIFLFEPKLVTVDSQIALSRNTTAVYKLKEDGLYESVPSASILPTEAIGRIIFGTPGQSANGDYIIVPFAYDGNVIELITLNYDVNTKTFSFIDSEFLDLADLSSSTIEEKRLNVGISPDGNKAAVLIPKISSPSGVSFVSYWMNEGVFGDRDVFTGNIGALDFPRDLRIHWPSSSITGDVDNGTLYLTGGVIFAITIGEDVSESIRISDWRVGYDPIISGHSHYTNNNHGVILSISDQTSLAIPTRRQVASLISHLSVIKIGINKGKVTSNGQNVINFNFPEVIIDTEFNYSGAVNTFMQSPYHYIKSENIYMVALTNVQLNPTLVVLNRDEDVWSVGYEYESPNLSTVGLKFTTDTQYLPDPEPPTSSRRRTWANWMQPRFTQS